MKMRKKTLAMLLAVTLLASSTPVGVFNAEPLGYEGGKVQDLNLVDYTKKGNRVWTEVTDGNGGALKLYRIEDTSKQGIAELQCEFTVPAEQVWCITFEYSTSDGNTFYVADENGQTLIKNKEVAYFEQGTYTAHWLSSEGVSEAGIMQVTKYDVVAKQPITLKPEGSHGMKLNSEGPWTGWWESTNRGLPEQTSELVGEPVQVEPIPNDDSGTIKVLCWHAAALTNDDDLVMSYRLGEDGVDETWLPRNGESVLKSYVNLTKAVRKEAKELNVTFEYRKNRTENTWKDKAYVKDDVKVLTLRERNEQAGKEAVKGFVFTPAEHSIIDFGWEESDKEHGLYTSNNIGVRGRPARTDVDFTVDSYGVLNFDWTVCSENHYDVMQWTLYGMNDDDTQEQMKILARGEMSGYDVVNGFISPLGWRNENIPLDEGRYKLEFIYMGYGIGSAVPDKGYVKNLTLTTYDDKTTIPQNLFATKNELQTAFGTGKQDRLGRINFGKYGVDTKYMRSYDEYGEFLGTKEKESPITWRVAGSEDSNSVVLYAERPLIGANVIVDAAGWETGNGNNEQVRKDGLDSRFAKIQQQEGTKWPNDYRYSNLRDQLQKLAEDVRFFSERQQSLMMDSTVKTNNYYTAGGGEDINPEETTTTDKLYPAVSDVDSTGGGNPEDSDGGTVATIYVGEASQSAIPVDVVRNRGWQWLRSPDDASYGGAALYASLTGVDGADVDNSYVDVSAAVKLNLSNVLFASAALATPATEELVEVVEGEIPEFVKIGADTPMELRLDGADKGLGMAIKAKDGQSVEITDAGENVRFVVQGVQSNGQNWCYSKDVQAGDSVITMAEIETAMEEAGIDPYEFTICKTWLEKTEDEVIYAVGTHEVCVDILTPEDARYAPAYDKLDAAHKLDVDRVLLVDAYLKNTVTGERLDSCTFKNPRTVSVEIPAGFDVDNMRAYYVTGAGDEFMEHWVEVINDKNYALFRTNHFSTYALVSAKASAKTGDSTHELSMMFAVLGLGALMIIARKKKIEI